MQNLCKQPHALRVYCLTFIELSLLKQYSKKLPTELVLFNYLHLIQTFLKYITILIIY